MNPYQVDSYRISAIHLRYARKLPHKAARLCALVARWRASESDGAALRSAIREAHQLKGTAGVYGFLTVSQWAASIEAQLSTSDTDWDILSYALDILLAAAKAQYECLLGTVCLDDTGRAKESA